MVAPSASYTSSETRPDPDDTPYVDDLIGFGKTVVDIESEMNPIQGMGEVAHEAWERTERAADGRSIPDLAARGEDMVLNGDPNEVWDQIKPRQAPGVDDSTTDAVGQAALQGLQIATDVEANVAPGGAFHGAMDAIDNLLPPKPDMQSQFSPLPQQGGGAEGNADTIPGEVPGPVEAPVHVMENADAVDSVMGDVVAPAPSYEPGPEPEPDSPPDAPMVLTSPDLDSGYDVSPPTIETAMPDMPDVSASFDSGASDDSGGAWDTGTDSSFDEGF
jgi:hypothetical protein